MVAQTLQFVSPTTTTNVKLLEEFADTVVASAASTAGVNAPIAHTATVNDVPAGRYRLVTFDDSGRALAIWGIRILLAAGNYPAYEFGDPRLEEKIDQLQETTTEVATAVGTGQIIVVSHQLPGEQIQLVRGDSFKESNGRFLSWKNATGAGWPPDLTDAIIRFTAVHTSEEGTPTVDVDASKKIVAVGYVVVATGPNQEVRCELEPTDTDREEGLYNYDVEATLPNSDVHTLVTTAPRKTSSQLAALNRQTRKLLEVVPHYTQAVN